MHTFRLRVQSIPLSVVIRPGRDAQVLLPDSVLGAKVLLLGERSTEIPSNALFVRRRLLEKRRVDLLELFILAGSAGGVSERLEREESKNRTPSTAKSSLATPEGSPSELP